MSLRFLLLILIVAVNGFFAAAEVALVSVRKSRLTQLAEEGSVQAKAALQLLANPEGLLSVTQFGVTLASLGLGWAGEDALYQLFLKMLHPVLTPSSAVYLHPISFTIAFLAMSYAHVVIGEVVPKNLALEKADRLALLVAPVLLVFQRIASPFVYVVERTSTILSRALGVSGHGGGGHSSEELKFIVESSGKEGHLEGFEHRAIQKLLEIKDISVREIMTPRMEIVSLPVEASLDDVLRISMQHMYSRLPVYEDKPEQIIGIVHFKDLMRAWQERKIANDRRQQARPFRLRRYLREPLVVPETKPLNQLVDEFRERHAHAAVVVDEFGTTTGLVTMEDVLEVIFGDIGDEHDDRRPVPAAGATVLDLDGSTTIRDLNEQYGIDLPADAGFQTLAGFLLAKFGNIPTPGESVVEANRTFVVQEMDRNRISKVRVLNPRPEPPASDGAKPAA
jgi:CBS domain containing-hemolysin-like protein